MDSEVIEDALPPCATSEILPILHIASHAVSKVRGPESRQLCGKSFHQSGILGASSQKHGSMSAGDVPFLKISEWQGACTGCSSSSDL
jgi:hypothetical protein